MEPTRRILLVDDEPTALQTLQKALEWHGRDHSWAVRSEEDPYRALEILKHWPADLLITDVHMPVMSGFDLLQQSQQMLPSLSAILLTASCGLEDVLRQIAPRQVEFLIKPCCLQEILGAVHRFLGGELKTLPARKHSWQKPLTQSLHHAYGLQIQSQSDVIEYLPIDHERLGVLIVGCVEGAVQDHLLRIGLRDVAATYLKEGISLDRTFRELNRFLEKEEESQSLNVLLGIFNRRRRTFAHLCRGFAAPMLQRQEAYQVLQESTISLHLRDVLHFNCSESSQEDDMDEFLKVTVAWGRRSQLEFSFAQDE